MISCRDLRLDSERSESSSCKTDYSTTADQAREVFLINYKLGSGLSFFLPPNIFISQSATTTFPLYYQVLVNISILLCRLFMKNIMPQKSNLATPRENGPIDILPFFFKITTHLVQINIYKNDKIFTGIPETLALNFILVSVTKVKAAAFLLLDCSHVTATVFQIEIL